MQRLLLVFALICSGGMLTAQTTLTLTLRDATTQEPISDAFVFFSGSSAGGVSDEEGKVELEMAENLELVISHLNYETKLMRAEEVLALREAVVLLTPSAIRINEVSVTSSARDANKRKRWLKSFTRALLGPHRDRKGVRILNPEVLLFAEGEAGLKAEAMDRIQIINEALGYELSFLLDTFLLTGQEEVFYGGKVFFQDLEDKQPERAAAWRASREKSFANSKSYFFRELAGGRIDLKRFEIGTSNFDKDLNFLSFSGKSPDQLRWRKGLRADTLYFSGFLTIADKTIVTKWTNQSAAGGVVADEYATSFLRSRSGRFIISPTGVLLNNEEVEELGHWADQRVARLLPVNYSPSGDEQEGTSLLVRYQDSLATFRRNFQQEKVYLHLDKPYYGLRDRIWFKAYLLDASEHRAQTPSKIVHVELVDPQGEIVKTLVLHRDRGLAGDFALDSTAAPGLYHIRAYTDYMRNSGPSCFFRRSLPVYDPASIGTGRLVGTNSDPGKLPKGQEKSQPFTLEVYPEGGVFLGGVENTLGLRSSGNRGKPLNLQGEILDLADRVVATWTTEHDGKGILKFTPQAGKPYWAQVTLGGVSYRIRLPTVARTGAVLHVNNLGEEDVVLRVNAPQDVKLEGAFLIGHVRGEAFLGLNEVELNKEMALPRSQIPTGLVCLSLFSKAGELIGERFFFNDHTTAAELKVATPYAFFRPRQKVRLEISWADSLTEEGAMLSVTVVDKAIVRSPAGEGGISKHILLDADLRGKVDAGNAALLNMNQRERFLLDLQLLAARPEHFGWGEVISGKSKQKAFTPRTGNTLRGYVTLKNKPEERVMAEVVLMALHPQPTIVKVLTDESGQFAFPDLPYLDTVNYVLQAGVFDPRKFNSDIPVLTTKKRQVTIHREETERPPLPGPFPRDTVQLPPALVDNFAVVASRDRRQNRTQGPRWSIDLEEVTVTGQKEVDSRNLEVFDLNKLDWVDPETSIYNLMSTLKPGYRFIQDMVANRLMAEVNDGYGFIVRVPASITIDGTLAGLMRLSSLKADQVNYIRITRRSVVVTTRNQPRSAAGRITPGVASFRVDGFFKGSKFFAPDYSNVSAEAAQPDGRTTIHWDPDLRVDPGKKAVVSFYASDVETEYEVRIEGMSDSGNPVFKTATVRIAE